MKSSDKGDWNKERNAETIADLRRQHSRRESGTYARLLYKRHDRKDDLAMKRKTDGQKDGTERQKCALPFHEKYLLTVEEATVYYHIGAKKFSQLLKDNPKAKWILMNGKRTMIKKDLFSMWLDQQSTI